VLGEGLHGQGDEITVQHETENEIVESEMENISKVASLEASEQGGHEGDNGTEKSAGFSRITSTGELQDILGSLLTAMKSEKQETIEAFRIETAKLSEMVSSEITKLAAEFENEHLKLSETLTQKIETETARLSRVIQQVQDETSKELSVAKTTIQEFTSETNSKFASHISSVGEITNKLSSVVNSKTDELSNAIIFNKGNTDQKIHDLDNKITTTDCKLDKKLEMWQDKSGQRLTQLESAVKRVESVNKPQLDLMNSEINNLKEKMSEYSTFACNTHSLQSAMTQTAERVHQPRGSESNTAATCSSENGVTPLTDEVSVSCNAYVPNANQPHVCGGTQVSSGPYSNNSCLASSDLTLPYFHDSSKVNAVFHLRQLEEYFKLKGVPPHSQLAIALRSVTDVAGISWLGAVSHTLNSYEDFKAAFVRKFWSKHIQSLAKCSTYQDRYQEIKFKYV
jgi:hypothetical protein